MNQPVHHELFVEDRQLHCNRGKLSKPLLRLMNSVFAVYVVAKNELVTVNAVEGENPHHHKIRNQQCGIERIPAIQMLERFIKVMGPEIMLQTMLGSKYPQAGKI